MRLLSLIHARTAEPPLASPLTGRHLGDSYTHKNIQVPPGADFYEILHGTRHFCRKRLRKNRGALALWLACVVAVPGEVCQGGVFGLVCTIFRNFMTVLWVIVVIYGLSEGSNKNLGSFCLI